MTKLGKVSFQDKREKPITVKKTRLKKGISFNPTVNSVFKKGGFIARGCGKVMNDRRKVTKVY
jgi:hypothetical protein